MPWAPDYLTLAEAKAYLRVADTVDDAEIAGWITAASRAIDRRCNRQFGLLAAPATRTYRRPAVYDATLGMWTVNIDDVMSTVGMTVNGVAFAAAGAVLLPDNAPLDGRPWTRIGFTYAPNQSSPGYAAATVMAAPWGWTAVPVQVPQAPGTFEYRDDDADLDVAQVVLRRRTAHRRIFPRSINSAPSSSYE